MKMLNECLFTWVFVRVRKKIKIFDSQSLYYFQVHLTPTSQYCIRTSLPEVNVVNPNLEYGRS